MTDCVQVCVCVCFLSRIVTKICKGSVIDATRVDIPGIVSTGRKGHVCVLTVVLVDRFICMTAFGVRIVSERGRFHVARRLCKCVNSNDVFIIFIHFVSFVFPYLRMDGFVCSSCSP